MHVNMKTLLLISEASTGKWLQTHPCTCHMRIHNNTRTQDCRDAVTSLKKRVAFIINCAKRSKCLKTWTKKSVLLCNLTIHKPASGSLICSGKSGHSYWSQFKEVLRGQKIKLSPGRTTPERRTNTWKRCRFAKQHEATASSPYKLLP